MKSRRMVIHDWNGCLLDDVPHRFEHGPCAIFRNFGLPEPSLDDYCRNISGDFMEWYYARGIPSSGDKKRDGDLLNGIMRRQMAAAPIPPLFPETREFLDLLMRDGWLQTLVSSLDGEAFARQFAHHGLSASFSETRADVRRKAPVFRELLDKYGVAVGDAVGVTDTLSDVRELAEVGIASIIVPRGYCDPDDVALATARVAADLHDALRMIRLA